MRERRLSAGRPNVSTETAIPSNAAWEWLGLAMVAMVLIHLLLAWGWIASQTRRFNTA